MSNEFDNFDEQIRNVLLYLKKIKEENKVLREQNIKLKGEIIVLSYYISIIEQKVIDHFIEIRV